MLCVLYQIWAWVLTGASAVHFSLFGVSRVLRSLKGKKFTIHTNKAVHRD
jgi:hypothetical protein